MADLSYGFNLPSLGNPIEALQQAGQQHERRAERNAMLARQQQKDKEGDEWQRTMLLKEQFNPEKIATGDITADQYLGSLIGKAQNEILSDPNLMKMPKPQLFGVIQDRMNKIIGTERALKDRIAQSDALAIAHGQKDPNINIGMLKQDLRRSAIGSVLKPDENGQLQFKPDDVYDPNDTAQNLMSGDDAGKYIISGKPMIDYIRNYKGDKFKYTKSLPDKSVVKYEGEVSPFKKLNFKPDANGGVPSNVNPELQINAEAYPSIQRKNPDGTTRPAMLLNEDTFEQHFANQSAFKKLWDDHKKDTGVRPQTRQEENILQREFAAKLIEDNDKSGILYDRQHLPSTHVTVNTGDKTPQVRNVYKEVSDLADQKSQVDIQGNHGITLARSVPLNEMPATAQKVLLDFTNDLLGRANTNRLGQKDIMIQKSEDGTLNILEAQTGKLISPITYADFNSQPQPSVKEKRKVIQTDNELKSKKPALQKVAKPKRGELDGL